MERPDAAEDDAATDDAFAFSAPTIVEAGATVSGRFGDDVRVTVRGADPDGDATSIAIALFDSSGTPVVEFDGNGDGLLDSNETTLPMAEPIRGAEEAGAFVSLPGFHLDFPGVSSLDVRIVDALGASSDVLHVALAPQPIVDLDGLCDPSFVANRCADGLGCPAAVPAVCAMGAAPTVARVAYLGDPGAVRVLVEGVDPDDDVSELVIAFFDAAGDPVSLDLDGDGIAESVVFHARLAAVSSGGAFFYAFEASDAFRADVAAVTVTAIDRGMHTSAPVHANAALATTRTAGQSCDAHGFDRCVGAVCMPSGATAYRCVSTTSARTMECGAAPMLDAFGAAGFAEGVAEGPSLWDAPMGCSSGDPSARPEGTLRLHLDRHASSVVLSTDNAYTSFDTTLYVLASCGAAPVVAWCADDVPASSRSWLSRLELLDVPAGDYVVVVDSFSPAGGRYRLDVHAVE